MGTKVGFIGLGAMGLPLAKNLQKKGFEVTGFDVDPTRADAIVELGGAKALTIAEACKGNEIVVTCLPATPHVEAVVLGEGGVLGLWNHQSPKLALWGKLGLLGVIGLPFFIGHFL